MNLGKKNATFVSLPALSLFSITGEKKISRIGQNWTSEVFLNLETQTHTRMYVAKDTQLIKTLSGSVLCRI